VSSRDDSDLPYVDGARINREPFTEETLVRAIRRGIGAEGKPLSVLMPHYVLDDAEMAALVEYLKHLTKTRVPGVSDSVLQFATIITPDADPLKATAMLSVLNDYFDEKNAAARRKPTPAQLPQDDVPRHAQVGAACVEAHGAGEYWEPQLQEHLAAEPVFAVLSGIGGKTWRRCTVSASKPNYPACFPTSSCRSLQRTIFTRCTFRAAYCWKPGSLLINSRNSPIGRRAPAGAGVSRGRYRRRSGNDARRRVAPIGARDRPARTQGGRGGFGPFIRPQRHWPRR